MSLNAEELFSERSLGFRPSEIRELLKLVDSPEIISLAGGMPDGRFFPIDRVIEASTFALREYGKKALQYDLPRASRSCVFCSWIAWRKKASVALIWTTSSSPPPHSRV